MNGSDVHSGLQEPDEMASTGLDWMVGELSEDGSKGKVKWDNLMKYAKSKG